MVTDIRSFFMFLKSKPDMLQLIFLFIVSKTVWKKMEKLVQS